MWKKIAEMKKFAETKADEMKSKGETDAWFEFENIADINVEEMSDVPQTTFQAIAYPLDENGNTVTCSSYIQLF